jgi:hypothetical protein
MLLLMEAMKQLQPLQTPNQFSYLDASVNVNYGAAEPGLKPENYRVASFKDVGTVLPKLSLMSEPVATIFLSPIEFGSLHGAKYA